ncbi:MAG TPA: hypothetical protein PK281_10635 [Flavobacteriales bacterium]|nr:hypothetical protein [Flavobacteriales bacterium]
MSADNAKNAKSKFKINQDAYVASSLLPNPNSFSRSLYKTKIVGQNLRKVTISLPSGEFTEIASSKVHLNIGLSIIEIGDFSTETTTLDPLTKALLNFSRLLIDDSAVVAVKLRSTTELDLWWTNNGPAYTHVILIGHGSPNGIHFAVDGEVYHNRLSQIFEKSNSQAVFISLCCETGCQSFSGEFSKNRFCKAIIAPRETIHAAVASQFSQAMLCWSLVEGKTNKIAFNRAKSTIAGAVNMTMWKNGNSMQ